MPQVPDNVTKNKTQPQSQTQPTNELRPNQNTQTVETFTRDGVQFVRNKYGEFTADSEAGKALLATYNDFKAQVAAGEYTYNEQTKTYEFTDPAKREVANRSTGGAVPPATSSGTSAPTPAGGAPAPAPATGTPSVPGVTQTPSQQGVQQTPNAILNKLNEAQKNVDEAFAGLRPPDATKFSTENRQREIDNVLGQLGLTSITSPETPNLADTYDKLAEQHGIINFQDQLSDANNNLKSLQLERDQLIGIQRDEAIADRTLFGRINALERNYNQRINQQGVEIQYITDQLTFRNNFINQYVALKQQDFANAQAQFQFAAQFTLDTRRQVSNEMQQEFANAQAQYETEMNAKIKQIELSTGLLLQQLPVMQRAQEMARADAEIFINGIAAEMKDKGLGIEDITPEQKETLLALGRKGSPDTPDIYLQAMKAAIIEGSLTDEVRDVRTVQTSTGYDVIVTDKNGNTKTTSFTDDLKQKLLDEQNKLDWYKATTSRIAANKSAGTPNAELVEGGVFTREEANKLPPEINDLASKYDAEFPKDLARLDAMTGADLREVYSQSINLIAKLREADDTAGGEFNDRGIPEDLINQGLSTNASNQEILDFFATNKVETKYSNTIERIYDNLYIERLGEGTRVDRDGNRYGAPERTELPLTSDLKDTVKSTIVQYAMSGREPDSLLVDPEFQNYIDAQGIKIRTQ